MERLLTDMGGGDEEEEVEPDDVPATQPRQGGGPLDISATQTRRRGGPVLKRPAAGLGGAGLKRPAAARDEKAAPVVKRPAVARHGDLEQPEEDTEAAVEELRDRVKAREFYDIFDSLPDHVQTAYKN
eukprot:3478696-Lingulodinium_polyedra.AAC.1